MSDDMQDWLQYSVVGLAVTAAVAYLTASLRRAARGSHDCSCGAGGCESGGGTASNPRLGTPRELIQLSIAPPASASDRPGNAAAPNPRPEAAELN